MNLSYAVSRSAFAIDVKFGDGFSRGNFSFYSFDTKRALYIKGKKEHNYRVVSPDFSGRFVDGYGVPESEYRKAKLEDLKRWDTDEPAFKNEKQIRKETIIKMLNNSDKIKVSDVAASLGITPKTVYEWLKGEKDTNEVTGEGLHSPLNYYNTNPIDKKIVWDEDELMEEEKKDAPI